MLICVSCLCQYVAHAAVRYRVLSKLLIQNTGLASSGADDGVTAFFKQLEENGRRWSDELSLANRAGMPQWAIRLLTRAFEQQVVLSPFLNF